MEHIEKRILFLRGRRVLLSSDLAEMYGVEPRSLIQAVKRNKGRFPEDFMFQLSAEEAGFLTRSVSRSQIVTLKRGTNIKHPPYAFTQEGVAMLSSVLRSTLAVKVNIEIMRAFVRMRYGLAVKKEALKKLIELERRIYGHDADIGHLFELIRQLVNEPSDRKRIGFLTDEKAA